MATISLEDMGLERYLNNSLESHNNHGYDDFVEQVKALQQGKSVGPFKVTKSAIGRMFNVHRHTVQSWIDLYNKDHEANDGPAV